MRVQDWIDESQRALANGNSFFNYSVDQRGENGAGCRCSTFSAELALHKQGDIVAVGCYVRNTTSVAVVKATVRGVLVVSIVIVGIWWVMVCEVRGNRALLVAGDSEYVGKALFVTSASLVWSKN